MLRCHAKFSALRGDFQPYGALSGDHAHIFERTDQLGIALGGDGAPDLFAAFSVAVIGDNFGTIGARAFDFQRRRIFRHDDHGPHAAAAGGSGDGLGMVAAGIGDNIGDAVRKAHYRVGGAAKLEGSGVLQVFAFHQQPEAKPVIHPR